MRDDLSGPLGMVAPDAFAPSTPDERVAAQMVDAYHRGDTGRTVNEAAS